jgi:hypothetical protein
VLAAIRPDSWNIALLVHVFGAMVLVGATITAMSAAILSMRAGDRPEGVVLSRLAFRTLLIVGIPAYFVMRGGAQWIVSKEHLENSKATWIGIGFGVADTGAIVLLLATIMAYVAARRARSTGRGGGWQAAAAVLTGLILAGYIVAIWAMGAKPT